MAARIPFPFTLIDERHRPFVDGRRGTLLTLFQVVKAGNYVAFAITVIAGLLFLFWGGKSLVYDLSVTWKTADAVITNIVLLPSGNSSNLQYLYKFKTDSGKSADGSMVHNEGDAHAIGDVVRVVYVQSDPQDNYYADDPLPRSVRDWFFVGMGVFLLSGGVRRLHTDLTSYWLLHRLARSGGPLPGEIVKAQAGLSQLLVADAGPPSVKIDYAFMIEGNRIEAHATMPFIHLAQSRLPLSGTKVAVWYMASEGAVLI